MRPRTTSENYWGYSHQRIIGEMTSGAGARSLAEASAGWRAVAERLASIRGYVNSAISGVRTSQQGAAADAAVGAMVPLGTWVDDAQQLATDTPDRIDYQISLFETMRNSVPAVPPEPRGGGWQEWPVIDSFTTSDQESDEAFNAEQARQARAAMMAYQSGTNDLLMGMGEFELPPPGEPDVSIPPGNRPTVDSLSGGSGAGAGGPGSPVPPAGTGASAPVELSAATPAPTGPQSGGIAGAEYTGGRPAPATQLPPGGAGLSGVVPGTPPAGGLRGTTGSGRWGPGRSGPGGAAGLRGGPATGSGSSAGRGPGIGGFGPRPGAGEFGPPGSPESATPRAAAAAGAGPVGAGRGVGSAGSVAPFGGVGGGHGGTDQERQRPSYLVEPDASRLIGELPPTAPAVIGEDPPDYGEPSPR